MAEMLGKPIDEFTLADLARENMPRVAADLALLDEAAQRRLRDHIYELFAAADTTRRAEEADNDYVRLQVDMFKRGKERGLLAAIAAAAHAAPASPLVAPSPAAPPAEPLVDDPRARATLLDLAPAFFAHTGMGASGRESNMQAFREFHGMTGGKGLAAITAKDVGDYKAWLVERPGRAGRPKASRKTVIKKLNHVRALLAWAAEDEGILAASPGEKVRPPKVSKKAEEQVKRLPFDPEALAAIFASPLYTGAFSPSRLGRPGPLPGAGRQALLPAGHAADRGADGGAAGRRAVRPRRHPVPGPTEDGNQDRRRRARGAYPARPPPRGIPRLGATAAGRRGHAVRGSRGRRGLGQVDWAVP